MAWETGTASGQLDLMNKLMTFLSTNPDLVANGQNWTVLRNSNLPFSFTPNSRIAWSDVGTTYITIAPDAVPNGIPAANKKYRVTGKLIVPSSGSYELSLRTNGQASIRIDGTLVAAVYSANLANSFVSSATVTLASGEHDIQVDYNLTSTSNVLSLGWKKPGDSAFSIIPAANYSALAGAYGYTSYYNPTSADMEAAMADKEYVVRGPGLSESDEIYVALATVSSAQNDLYNVLCRYATGFDATKSAHPNATLLLPGVPTSISPYLLAWNQSIKYWFIANGRRFIVIAKVSTTYASMYGGFVMPYGLPSEFPYPIAAGASCAANLRWSDQTTQHSSFWNPAGLNSQSATSLGLRRTDGSVDAFKNIFGSSDGLAWTYPYRNNIGYRSSPDSSYAIQPIVLFSSLGGGNVWGELDGVFHISGFSNAAENIFSLDGDDYLVVQSGFRTATTDYAAILLE